MGEVTLYLVFPDSRAEGAAEGVDAVMRSTSEERSYLRLIDFCITQL